MRLKTNGYAWAWKKPNAHVFLTEYFSNQRRDVFRQIAEIWDQREGESRKTYLQRLRRKGIRVVPVKLVELSKPLYKLT